MSGETCTLCQHGHAAGCALVDNSATPKSPRPRRKTVEKASKQFHERATGQRTGRGAVIGRGSGVLSRGSPTSSKVPKQQRKKVVQSEDEAPEEEEDEEDG